MKKIEQTIFYTSKEVDCGLLMHYSSTFWGTEDNDKNFSQENCSIWFWFKTDSIL
jgi:hypothetical protein